MLLTVDIGNTNICFAVFKGKKIVHKWRLSTHSNITADEYYLNVSDFLGLKKIKLKQIKNAIISNVVPQSIFEIKSFFEKYLKITPLIVGEKNVKLPLKINVPNVAEVGADRIVNSVGALLKFAPPLIIIDFGTATTFDVIDKNKNYIGGIIAPGANLSLSALHRLAAKLPQIEIAKPESVIGKSTVLAMQSGIFFGYKGLIEGIIDEISLELNQKPTVITTGGLGVLFKNASSKINHHEEDLTLLGLKEIFRVNS